MANPSSTSPTPLCRIVAVLVSSIPFLCASAVGIETVVQRTFDAVPEGARSDNFYQPAFFQLSSDERLLLLGRGTEIHVYDIKTRCLVERIEFGRGTFIGGAVLDPSGRFLLYSTETAPSYDPEVRLRSLQTGRETDPAYFEIDFERPESEVTEPIVIDSAELDPDRPIRCSVLPGSAIFVDLGSGGSLRLPFTTSFDAEARRRALPGALSTRDGMTIRWEGGSTLRWTDRNGGSFVAPLIADPELRCVRVAELHFGGDGRLLFGGIDAGRFLLVDVFDDELIFEAALPGTRPADAGESDPPSPSFDFEPKAGLAALSNGAGSIAVHDAISRALVASVEGWPPYALSEDGTTLAYTRPSAVVCRSLASGAETRIPRPSDPMETSTINLSPDGSLLAVSGFSAGDAPGTIYETSTGRALLHVPQMHGPLQFDSSGRRMAYAEFGGRGSTTIALVDIPTRAVFRTHEMVPINGFLPDSITFGPGGSSLLIPNGESGVTRLNFGPSGFGPPQGVLDGFFSGEICYSPDRSLAAAIRHDGSVAVFRTDGAAPQAVAALHLLSTGRVVAMTSRFEYMARPESLDAVAFRIGARAFPADQFDLALNRPASVLAALGADDEMVRAAESARSRRLRRLGLAEEDLGLSPDLPAITVLNRDAIPLAVEKGEITLRVRASRTARPLDRLLLYVNGVPVLGSRGKSLRPEGAMEASMDIPVRLASGPNKVQVSAVDTWGAESIRETVYVNRASPREEGGKVYILSIGVSDYEDEELDLGLAAKDARDIVAAFAANRGDRAQVVHRILEDRVATRENILASRSLFDTCEADDLAVVFIAGHGFQDENYEYWFGTPDIDHEHPARRGLSFDDLESLFDGIAAQRRLLLMDTCFAGEVDPDEIAATLRSDESTTGVSVRAPAITRSAAAGDGRRSGPANLAERFFAEFRKGTGATVLTASAGVEFVFAEETDDIGNGVFTHCVMRVLREPGLADEDGDGAVRASELLRYVSREVPLLTSQRQVPTGRQLNRDLDMVVSDSPRD